MGFLYFHSESCKGSLENEEFDGYSRQSGEIVENGTAYWISQITRDNGSVEGTRTNRHTGEVESYRYEK